MNAFFCPLNGGFYFAKIRGFKVTDYSSLRRKNLHFLPVFSVRSDRCLPWKKRSKLKCFTLNPVPELRAIELARIAEVSSRGRDCS